MINVDYGRSKDTFFLSMHGHAEFSADGNDIVCSAASMLITTLAQLIKTIGDDGGTVNDPLIHLDSGVAFVTCTPKPGHKAIVNDYYKFALTGFKLLESQYPENVKTN